MYTYERIKLFDGGFMEGIIRRLPDNTGIPFDPNNTDYQAYLKWLDGYEQQFNSQTHQIEWVKTSEGNTPLPADE